MSQVAPRGTGQWASARTLKIRALAVERSWEEGEEAGGPRVVEGRGVQQESVGCRGLQVSGKQGRGRRLGEGTSERERGSLVQPNSGLGRPGPQSSPFPKPPVLPGFGGDTEAGLQAIFTS